MGIMQRWIALTVVAVSSLVFVGESRAQHATRAAPGGFRGIEAVRGERRVTPRWKRRARGGVLVVDSRDEADDLPDGALRPRQVRTLGLRPMRQGLVELSAWPAEPSSPNKLDRARFAKALTVLCPPWLNKKVVHEHAENIVRYSEHFGVDPMLLAALVYQQSRCQSGMRNSYGIGLAMINPNMHRRAIRDGVYRYGVLAGETWQGQLLNVSQFEFNEKSLMNARANLYFAAAFLSIFKKQCSDIDAAFGSAPHRSHISHAIWGDRVRGPGPEDRILLARRRLLQYYSAGAPPRMGRLGNLELYVPLDGTPRMVTSQFGDERDHGARLHRGVDFLSELGEPVRAVAAGVVIEAGAQFRRRGIVNIDPKTTPLIPAGRFGPQGLLVRIQHAGQVQTLYAHLIAYNVRVGQRVERGQLLGYVGRTGMKESDAHLHFGLFKDGEAVDPETVMETSVFPFAETWGAGSSRPERADTMMRVRRRRHHSVPRAGRVRPLNQTR